MNESSQCAGAEDILVAPLHSFSRTDVELAGGKGSSLGELIRAGFPVPAGFVVTTAAYDCFVTANNLGQTIARALDGRQDSGQSWRCGGTCAGYPRRLGIR